jgi:protein-S-isoprenylcysteine O-methyltransferase Ste14
MTLPRLNFAELIAKSVGMQVVFTLSLFLPAGTLAWPTGWVYVAISFVFGIGLTAWLARYDPELLAERLTGLRKADRKKWDKVFVPIIAVGFFVWLALMGLDAVRFRWSAMPMWLQATGFLLLLISCYVFYLTFRENPYLSPAVRIQKERGQTVVSTGPYRHVRHPMYAGFSLYLVGTALMLGSWLGVASGLLLIAAVARRAVLEERTLQQKLPGYGEYMMRVRYRLIPEVW